MCESLVLQVETDVKCGALSASLRSSSFLSWYSRVPYR